MNPALRRLVIAASLAVAFALFYIAVDRAQTGPTVTTTVAAVERLIPPPGALELRQARVGVDLASGYTGVLIIGGIEIPEDQLERIEPLNEVSFAPRPGREIETFDPGPVCVRAVYWQIGTSRTDSDNTEWCFEVTA